MLMVCAGVFLTVFLYSWMQGIIGDMVSTNARFDTGHVKITTRAYSRLADEMPNDLALLGLSDLMAKLRSAGTHMIWTPRIRFGGLLDVPDEHGETRIQGPVVGMGVDLLSEGSPEKIIFDFHKALVRGSLPRAANDILISEMFARRLGVKPGDTVTLISSTMFGSMALHNFTISGTVRFGISMMDRQAIIADLGAVRDALDMKDGAGEIVGYSRDMVYSDESMKRLVRDFNRDFSRESDRFSPMMVCLSG